MPEMLSDSPAIHSSRNYHKYLKQLGALAGLLLAYAFFSMMRPRTFFTVDTIDLILRNTAIVATAAMGMTLIIISNGIDLSIGSQIALFTVLSALMVKAGISPVLAVFLATLINILIGLFSGVLITWLRLLPFIVTLGTTTIIRGIAMVASENTTVEFYDRFNSRHPMPWIGRLLVPLDSHSKWMLVSPGVWLTIFIAIMVGAILRYTRFGRHVFAIGSNEQTARLCGIRVHTTRIIIYGISGLLTAVAGMMEFSRLQSGDPTTDVGRELDVIAAVVIGGASLSGGQGSVIGTLTGALLMSVVSAGCVKMELSSGLQSIVTGVIIMVAVLLDRLQNRKG